MRVANASLALGLLLAAGPGCRGASRPSPPPAQQRSAVVPAEPGHPASVSALRYRTWISTAGPERAYQGYWTEALWFPAWKLGAWVYRENWDGPPRLAVSASDWPRANTKSGAAFIPTGGDPRGPYQGPTENVEVPWSLAERIRAAGELQAAYRATQERLGPELEASGLLREVPNETVQ